MYTYMYMFIHVYVYVCVSTILSLIFHAIPTCVLFCFILIRGRGQGKQTRVIDTMAIFNFYGTLYKYGMRFVYFILCCNNIRC